jgi:hypothetical protein
MIHGIYRDLGRIIEEWDMARLPNETIKHLNYRVQDGFQTGSMFLPKGTSPFLIYVNNVLINHTNNGSRLVDEVLGLDDVLLEVRSLDQSDPNMLNLIYGNMDNIIGDFR